MCPPYFSFHSHAFSRKLPHDLEIMLVNALLFQLVDNLTPVAIAAWSVLAATVPRVAPFSCNGSDILHGVIQRMSHMKPSGNASGGGIDNRTVSYCFCVRALHRRGNICRPAISDTGDLQYPPDYMSFPVLSLIDSICVLNFIKCCLSPHSIMNPILFTFILRSRCSFLHLFPGQ